MLARTRDVLLLSLTLLFANLMYGQGGANGTILGTVTDNSGAVVAGANVDVTNTDECHKPHPNHLVGRLHDSIPLARHLYRHRAGAWIPEIRYEFCSARSRTTTARKCGHENRCGNRNGRGSSQRDRARYGYLGRDSDGHAHTD